MLFCAAVMRVWDWNIGVRSSVPAARWGHGNFGCAEGSEIAVGAMSAMVRCAFVAGGIYGVPTGLPSWAIRPLDELSECCCSPPSRINLRKNIWSYRKCYSSPPKLAIAFFKTWLMMRFVLFSRRSSAAFGKKALLPSLAAPFRVPCPLLE